MKKYFVLTSILALAACGGGTTGGGVIGGAEDIVKPTEQTAFERAAESNQEVTGMVSRIKKGDTYVNLAMATGRAAGGAHSDGAYYLDNVTFKSADKKFGDPREDLTVKFKLDDDGKIIAMHMIDDMEELDVTRVGNENKFVMEEGIDDTFGYATLNMLGKELGMKYSDFGFLEMYGSDDPEKAMFIMPIAGGYEVKNVELNKDDFSNDIVFNGTAVGSVGEASTEVEGERLTLKDGSATLTFDKASGDQILAAKFSNWYDVKATQYHDGDAQIEFTNGAGIENDKFRFRDGDATVNEFDTGKVANNSAEHVVSVDFDYYGDSAKDPREATGIVFYSQDYGPTDDDSVDFFMGFGGTRK